MIKQITHYLELYSERKLRLNSIGIENDAPLCSNGQPLHHLRKTRYWKLVNCSKCIKKQLSLIN